MVQSLICQQVFLQIKQENVCSQLFQVTLYKRFHLIQKFDVTANVRKKFLHSEMFRKVQISLKVDIFTSNLYIFLEVSSQSCFIPGLHRVNIMDFCN